MLPSTEKMSEIDEKYEVYSTLDEWSWLHDVLLKIDRECSPWMHAVQVLYLKKILFVQIVEKVPFVEETEKSPVLLDA